MKISSAIRQYSFACNLFFIIIFFHTASAQTGSPDQSNKGLALKYDNFIVPPTADYVRQGANGGVPVPATGDNNIWNYSQLTNNDAFSFAVSYVPPNNSFFSTARRKTDFIFPLNETILVQETGYEADDNSAYHRLGRSVQRQAFPLGALSGFMLDSLVINQQDVSDEGTLNFVRYPCKKSSSWSSSIRATTGFQLSFIAFGLDHTPGEFVQRQTLTRSVVGSGKMRIPGAEKKIDVLMVRSTFTNIDSVYLGGLPAPPEILLAFGLTQGQETQVTQYVFLRAGIDEPLITFYMNADFSAVSFIQYDTRFANIYCGQKNEFICSGATTLCLPFADVTPVLLSNNTATVGSCTNSNKNENGVYAQNATAQQKNNLLAVIYPNPSRGAFQLRLTSFHNGSTSIRIFDVTGKTLSEFNTRDMQSNFGSELKPGVYFAEIRNNNTRQVIRLVKL